MSDPTETVRRNLQALLNSSEFTRAEVELRGVQCWDTQELSRDFVVDGFRAPFVVVTRKVDGVVGTLMFRHHPRLYFGFEPDGGPEP
jgi:hypothetical protein